MTTSFTPTAQSERFLEAFVEDLTISETRYEQAVRSYESLGRWLHRDASTVRLYKPQVYVQGSFGLGTVIKPISDAEDYDVDTVCEFGALNTGSLTQFDLKRKLGVEVKDYHDAQSMAKPVREGRRCWVLDYADGAQFHMDIVPAVLDADRQRRLLETARRTSEWSPTGIAITDNERWNYKTLDQDWCRSNPKGYVRWFRQRMQVEFEVRRARLAKSIQARVESVPEYRVRTPLQSAIMILKRHRDIRFSGEDNRPISIIITTLAAHAYQSENQIGQALVSILSRMDQFIEHVNGRIVIRNPTDPLENFADKWHDHPERAKAFFDWLNQARRDFQQIAATADLSKIAASAAPAMGKGLTDRTMKRTSPPNPGLLRAASVAPAVGGLSFPDKPRVPTQPKGFA